MNIELTKEQYEQLIVASGMAGAVLGLLNDMTDGDVDYEKQYQKMDALEKYLLGFAKDAGLGDWVEDFEGETVLKDEAYEKRIKSILDDYEDFVSTDLLANKLAWRDFLREHTEAEMAAMAKKNGGYFGVELHPYEEKYWKEFEEYDVDRLEINESK